MVPARVGTKSASDLLEKNPNVEIEFRPLTGATQQDNYGKMYALFAAGDLGDVIAFDPSHFHFWRAINENIIGPIDELVASDKIDLKQWFDQFIGLQYYNGKLYGLPSWGWAGQDTLVINAVHIERPASNCPIPKATPHRWKPMPNGRASSIRRASDLVSASPTTKVIWSRSPAPSMAI